MQKIFISSTFRDFQTERDYIRNVVQPQLAAICNPFGETIAFTDLRWGIDTSDISEEEHENKVLSVCLNEISQSKPYMIVLLGDRYGYIADEHIIHNIASQKNLFLDDEEISATQLEIEYGALCEEAKNNNVFFYIRQLENNDNSIYDAENDEAKRKLEQLKKRISETAGSRVRYYNASLKNGKPDGEYIEKLGEDIVSDISNLITKKFKSVVSENDYIKDNLIQWNYLKEKQRSFLARRDAADSIIEKLRKPYASVGITGEIGSGKSTIFAEVLSQCKDIGYTVIPFFCGNTQMTSSSIDILLELIYMLEDTLGETHTGFSDTANAPLAKCSSPEKHIETYRTRLIELCKKINKTQTDVVIAIDGIDQLCADTLSSSLVFLPEANKHIRILITSNDEKLLPDNFENIRLSTLSGEEKLQVIERILQISGKELPKYIIESALRKQTTGNALYLYLLVQRLMLLQENDYKIIYLSESASDAIRNSLSEIIESLPDDLEGITQHLLDGIQKKLSPSIRIAIDALGVSRYGLREQDIEKIYVNKNENFTSLDLVILTNYFNELSFLRSDGRIDFLHKCVRNAIISRIDNPSAIHNDIVDALAVLPDDDNVKINEFQYHTISAHRKKQYIEYISKLTKEHNIEGLQINVHDIFITAEQAGEFWTDDFISALKNNSANSDSHKDNLIELGDYINFIYYLTFHITNNVAEKAQDIKVAQKLCLYCVEMTEKMNKSNDEDFDLIVVYAVSLSCLASTFHDISDSENSIKYAEMSLMAYKRASEIRPGYQTLTEFINEFIKLIIYKQSSHNTDIVKESLDDATSLLSFVSSQAEENATVEWVRYYLLLHLLVAISYYNLDPIKYRDEALEYLQNGVNFIEDFDEEFSQYFIAIEKQLVNYIVQLGGQPNSKNNVYEELISNLENARKEYEVFPSTKTKNKLFTPLNNLVSFLLNSENKQKLKQALSYAKEAKEIAESIRQDNPTPINIYKEAEIYIATGQIFSKLHLLVKDDMLFDALAFQHYLQASSIVKNMEDSYKDSEKETVTRYQCKIYTNLSDLLINLKEQFNLAVVYVCKALDCAESLYEHNKTTENIIAYSKAKINFVICQLMQCSAEEMDEHEKTLVEIENILINGIDDDSLEERSLQLAKVYLYRAQIHINLDKKQKATEMLQKSIGLAQKCESGEDIVKKAFLLINKL